MREIDRILDGLRRGYDGDAWHGTAVRTLLDHVDWRTAAWRPAPDVHTICEIVLHMTAWTREVARRLRDGVARDPADGDWPSQPAVDEAAWTAILAGFDTANDAVLDAVSNVRSDELDARIGDVRDRALGSGVSRYVTMHGLAQHHAYHGGQIALLKKLASELARSQAYTGF